MLSLFVYYDLNGRDGLHVGARPPPNAILL